VNVAVAGATDYFDVANKLLRKGDKCVNFQLESKMLVLIIYNCKVIVNCVAPTHQDYTI
jgi:hypothetical protein